MSSIPAASGKEGPVVKAVDWDSAEHKFNSCLCNRLPLSSHFPFGFSSSLPGGWGVSCFLALQWCCLPACCQKGTPAHLARPPEKAVNACEAPKSLGTGQVPPQIICTVQSKSHHLSGMWGEKSRMETTWRQASLFSPAEGREPPPGQGWGSIKAAACGLRSKGLEEPREMGKRGRGWEPAGPHWRTGYECEKARTELTQ